MASSVALSARFVILEDGTQVPLLSTDAFTQAARKAGVVGDLGGEVLTNGRVHTLFSPSAGIHWFYARPDRGRLHHVPGRASGPGSTAPVWTVPLLKESGVQICVMRRKFAETLVEVGPPPPLLRIYGAGSTVLLVHGVVYPTWCSPPPPVALTCVFTEPVDSPDVLGYVPPAAVAHCIPPARSLPAVLHAVYSALGLPDRLSANRRRLRRVACHDRGRLLPRVITDAAAT
jgi:hypothetical protein